MPAWGMLMTKSIADLPGCVMSISLTGQVTYQFMRCFMEMRSYNETRVNLRKVEYDIRPGVLVESARDDIVAHALKEKYEWVLQIDADATFPPETLHRLLEQAYIAHPTAGVVGAYANLKPPPHLPTVDTGTGTWEAHYPGEGVIPVIRTGCHCFLTKTWVFLKLGRPPWFRTRLAQNPIQAFREVDGFARRHLSGKNPLQAQPEWETLLEAARAASTGEQTVGEDSSFFDRCRSHGVEVLVDTDLITGHVASKILHADDFRKNILDNRKMQMAALGVNS